MRKTKRSKARALWLIVFATSLAIAFVLFSPRRPTARAAGALSSAEPAATSVPAKRGGKSGAKPDTQPPSATADGGAADAGSPSPEASPPAPALSNGPSAEASSSIPEGNGLPVRVTVGVYFLEVTSFDDTKGEFEATVDVRLRWTDTRLRYPAKEAFRGYREWIGKSAEEQLGKIWQPTIDVKNRSETGPYVGHRLRIFPDGKVESMTRTTGRYKGTVRPESFPFDHQDLRVELIVREDTVDEVKLRFEQDDVAFSRVSRKAELDGWRLGLVDLTRSEVSGWNGDRYSVAVATLSIDRDATSALASVFIPLLASLLIPLLALWMNDATEEGFAVEAFELANMGIGGLFSVIALSFAIYSANPILATSDNTVTRLFGLNYATLALSLVVVVTFFRYELPRRWFGIHVQREMFRVVSWAIPVLTLATSIAFLLVAAA